MANENIVRGIFQVGIEMAEVEAGLNKIVSKYKGVTAETDTQVKKLQELTNQEAKLLENRAKSNNPSVIAVYNKKLEDVKKQITTINSETKKMVGNEVEATKAANELSKGLQAAFQTTSINGLNKKLQEVKKELASVSTGAKKFLKDMADGIKNPVNEFTKLRNEIKLAKGELAAAFAGGNQAAIQAASEKVGLLKDQMDDLNEASTQFASGSKFQQIGNIFGDVGQKLLSLDFEGAAARSKALVNTTKQLTFKEGIKGVKDLGTTFLNIGKALLTNPIFLIAGAIALIVSNFDKLKTSGGFIGKIFGSIAKAIEIAGTAIKDFLGFLGLIDPLKKSLEEIIDINERLIKSTEAFYDRQIKLAEASNQSITKLNNQRANETLKLLNEELKATRKAYDTREIDLKEFSEKSTDIAIRASNIQTDRQVKNIETVKKAEDGLREQRKKLLEEQQKGNSFDIQFKLAPGSEAQTKAALALQLKQLAAAAKEEKRLAAIEFKDFDGGAKAKYLIQQRFNVAKVNLEAAANKQILDNRFELEKQALEVQKQNAEVQLTGVIDTEDKIAAQKLNIQLDYYSASIVLAQKDIEDRAKLGLSTVQQEKDLAALRLSISAAESQGEREINRGMVQSAIERTSLLEENSQTELSLSNATQSAKLRDQLKFEKDKLTALQAGGKEFIAEAQRQSNTVAELEKEARKQQILEIVDYYETASTAAIDAANTVVSSKIRETDYLIGLQQKRVDEIKNIADQGNAEMLELEKKRLEDINKEKEKFVRQQQVLASLELIANTAVAVSKAAAQGGAGAAFTIAAALLALGAGLISARQIASQAAFYKGGEFSGYTGDGNPRSESTAVGQKPYTYHKREFIFNHEKTDKYRDIFKRIHGGDIDLKDWQQKVQLFDGMQKDFNIKNPYIIKAMGGMEGQRLDGVEKLLQQLVRVTENKESPSFSMDKDGLFYGIERYGQRRKLIDKLAR